MPFLTENLKKKIKRILIIYWGFFGDVLISTPFIEVLRRGFPKAHITYLLGRGAYYAEHVSKLLQHNPHIDECIKSDPSILAKLLSCSPYDLAIDLCDKKTTRMITKVSGAKVIIRGRYRQIPKKVFYNVRLDGKKKPFLKIPVKQDRLYRVEQFLAITRLLGINSNGIMLPKIYLLKKEKILAKKYIENLRDKKGDIIIAMHPGGQDPFRLWETGNYALLADRLIERFNAKIIIFYAGGEKSLTEEVCNLSHYKIIKIHEKDIRKYVALLTACDLFITTDGGPLQMVLAAGGSAVGIFHHRPNALYWYNRKRKGLFCVFTERRHYNTEEALKNRINKIDEKEVEMVFKKAQEALILKHR